MIDQDTMLTQRANGARLVVEYSKKLPNVARALHTLLTLPMIDDEDLLVYQGTRTVDDIMHLKGISGDVTQSLLQLCMCIVENESIRLGMTDNHMPITLH